MTDIPPLDEIPITRDPITGRCTITLMNEPGRLQFVSDTPYAFRAFLHWAVANRKLMQQAMDRAKQARVKEE